MNQSLFGSNAQLDTAYLDQAYADDAQTAAFVFEQYLQELPANLELLEQSIAAADIDAFRHHIHKQKPSFSYVGLTDVTEKFHDLQLKCNTREDLATYQNDITQVVQRIKSSRVLLEQLLQQLQAL